MVIPPVRIHDEIDLDSHEYVFKVRGTAVARGSIMAGHHLAMDPGDAVGSLPGIPTTEPAFGLPATWIPESQHAEAEALGYTVVDGESVIVTHLTETIRKHAAQLLTRQDVRQLLDQLKEINEAVVTEVVPDVLSLGEIQRVLQALLSEGVSIRDLGAIVEAVGDKARVTRDPSLLAEYARQALGPRDHRAAPRPDTDAARDHARPGDRAGARDFDHPDERRRVPGDGADPRTGCARRRAQPVRARRGARRRPARAALLGPRPAPPPAAGRGGCTAPARLFLQRSRPRHQRRNHRSRHRMSPQSQTPSQTNGHHTELRGVRTYRGRKLEDLIPQIREELGPDAIILRQREGLIGGVGGFFAQKCVEVDAQAPQPRVDIYDEHDVDQSLLDEIEDPYADPVPEVTLELPALESGEIAYEPIEPAEAVRPETPNLIETFYVPTGGIDGTIDELPDEFGEPDFSEQPTGYERHAAELPVLPAQPDEPVGPSFVERLQEAAGLIADAPAPVAAQPAPVAVEPEPVAVEPEPLAVEPQPEPFMLAEPVLTPEPAPVMIEPEPFIAPEPAPVAVEPEPARWPLRLSRPRS